MIVLVCLARFSSTSKSNEKKSPTKSSTVHSCVEYYIVMLIRLSELLSKVNLRIMWFVFIEISRFLKASYFYSCFSAVIWVPRYRLYTSQGPSVGTNNFKKDGTRTRNWKIMKWKKNVKNEKNDQTAATRKMNKFREKSVFGSYRMEKIGSKVKTDQRWVRAVYM